MVGPMGHSILISQAFGWVLVRVDPNRLVCQRDYNNIGPNFGELIKALLALLTISLFYLVHPLQLDPVSDRTFAAYE